MMLQDSMKELAIGVIKKKIIIILKKPPKKFGGFKIKYYLCNRNNNN